MAELAKDQLRRIQQTQRERMAELEAALAEECRVMRLIVHLRHFTPSTLTVPLHPRHWRKPAPQPRPAPQGVPAPRPPHHSERALFDQPRRPPGSIQLPRRPP